MKAKFARLPPNLALKLSQAEDRALGLLGLSSLLVGLGIFLGLVIVAWLSDRLWDTPRHLRLAFSLGALALLAWTTCSFVRRRLRLVGGATEIIRIVQNHYPRLGDSLQGAAELADPAKRPESVSASLCKAAVEQVAASCQTLDFDAAVSQDERNRIRRRVLAAAALTAIFLLADPRSVLNSLQRSVMPYSEVERQTFARFLDAPSEIFVPAGEDFSFEIRVDPAARVQPERVDFAFDGEATQSAPVAKGLARISLKGRTRDAELQLGAFDARTRILVRQVERPVLAGLDAEVKLPAYLGDKKARTLALSGGGLQVVEGASFTLHGRATTKLESAQISGPLSQKLKVEGSSFRSAEIVQPKESASLAFLLKWSAEHGIASRDGQPVDISWTPDAAPTVQITDLPASLQILESDSVKLPLLASDDNGLKSIGLELGVQSTDEAAGDAIKTRRVQVAAGAPEKTDFSQDYVFSPRLLKIAPGHRVAVLATALDYRPGRQASRSERVIIQILSHAEHAAWLQQQLEALQSRLEGLAKEELAGADLSQDLAAAGAKGLEGESQAAEAAESEEQRRQKIELELKALAALLTEALKNQEFPQLDLVSWKGAYNLLAKAAAEPMNQAQQQLAGAAPLCRDSGAKAAVKKGLESAALAQEKAAEMIAEAAKKAEEARKKAELANMSKRLHKLASAQQEIAALLGAGGTIPSKAQRQALSLQTPLATESTRLGEDIRRFFTLTQTAKYGEVADELERRKTSAAMSGILAQIQARSYPAAAAEARQWAPVFAAWAKKLEPSPKEQAAGGGASDGGGDKQPDELMIGMIKTLAVQQQIYNDSRYIHDHQTKLDHDAEAEEIAQTQAQLADDFDKIVALAKEAEMLEALDAALVQMRVATKELRAHQSLKSLPPQAAVIEILTALLQPPPPPPPSASQNQNKDQKKEQDEAMKAMMQQMQKQAPPSSTPPKGGEKSAEASGQGGSGGQGVTGAGASGPASSASTGSGRKASGQGSGALADEVPAEYREAFENFYKKAETTIDETP